jgi:MYXO-CTERM domain-containing protein
VLRTLARNWWLVLAGLVGIFEIAFGVAIPLEEGANFDTVGGGALIAAAGLLMLAGIAVRRRRSRIAGDIMIAVGALPMIPWLWIIPLPLAGLTVIVASAFDSAEARSLGERGTPLPAGERLVLAGVVIVAAALVAAVLIAGPMPGTLIIAPALLGLVVYLGLRQRRRAA